MLYQGGEKMFNHQFGRSHGEGRRKSPEIHQSRVGKLIQAQRNIGRVEKASQRSRVHELLKTQRSSGEKAALDLLPGKDAIFANRKANLNETLAIKQHGYASGDRLEIAATLIHNPHARIFITGHGPRDH
jgi:hypothetical protein